MSTISTGQIENSLQVNYHHIHLTLESTIFWGVVPVLPSANIDRDIRWYEEKAGFEKVYADKMYAVIKRENIYLHLQWHADTTDDPLLGGSVIRIAVKNIRPIFEEFLGRGTVAENKLVTPTPWNTSEFGFYDLNQNAIFIVEDLG